MRTLSRKGPRGLVVRAQIWLLAGCLLAVPFTAGAVGGARSYSSGGGRSFSGGGTKSYSGGSGKSYGSGGSAPRSYNSGKSYSSGGNPPPVNRSSPALPAKSPSGPAFDPAASRATKEQTSKQNYATYQHENAPRPANGAGGNGVPPVIPRGAGNGNGGGGYSRTTTTYHHTTVYVDHTIYTTRPYRLRSYYEPYYSRPVIIYHDPYSSFFWWWLLDRSIEEQALWAYHHRADMDAARYQALLNSNAQLEGRIHQLEAQQVAPNPQYSPTGLDQDLMYDDQTVNRAYAARPTQNGQAAFWLVMVPAAVGVTWLLGWLVFFKRWQTSNA